VVVQVGGFLGHEALDRAVVAPEASEAMGQDAAAEMLDHEVEGRRR
jgi:hypothetical protein